MVLVKTGPSMWLLYTATSGAAADYKGFYRGIKRICRVEGLGFPNN